MKNRENERLQNCIKTILVPNTLSGLGNHSDNSQQVGFVQEVRKLQLHGLKKKEGLRGRNVHESGIVCLIPGKY